MSATNISVLLVLFRPGKRSVSSYSPSLWSRTTSSARSRSQTIVLSYIESLCRWLKWERGWRQEVKRIQKLSSKIRLH